VAEAKPERSQLFYSHQNNLKEKEKVFLFRDKSSFTNHREEKKVLFTAQQTTK
jgi:hypothetical protein